MFKKCDICGKGTSFLRKIILVTHGNACTDCLKKAQLNEKTASTLTVNSIISRIKQFDANSANEQPTGQTNAEAVTNGAKPEPPVNEYKQLKETMKAHGATELSDILFDDSENKLLIKKGLFRPYRLYNYADIVDYKPIVEGKQISKHHRITRGAVGGILLGGPGMVIGALTGGKEFQVVSKMSIVIYFSNGDNFECKFVTTDTKTNGMMYKLLSKSANQLEAKLKSIMVISTVPSADTADEDGTKKSFDAIRELKALLDEGAITQAEFDQKKKQLLDL